MTVCSKAGISVVIGLLFLTSCVCVFRLWYMICSAIHGVTFRRRADDGPSLNAGLVALYFKGIPTSIAKEPYIYVIFQGGGGGGGPPVPPLDPHMKSHIFSGIIHDSHMIWRRYKELNTVFTSYTRSYTTVL